MHNNVKAAISRFINGREKPLTMYIFSEDKAVQVKLIIFCKNIQKYKKSVVCPC